MTLDNSLNLGMAKMNAELLVLATAMRVKVRASEGSSKIYERLMERMPRLSHACLSYPRTK